MGMMQGLLAIWPMGEIKTFPRAYVSFTAAATTGTLYTLSTGKTAILSTVMVSRRGGGDGFLQIGEGDFTQIFPDIRYISGQHVTASIDGAADALPVFIFEANITARVTVAAAAANDVRVLATVFEF